MTLDELIKTIADDIARLDVIENDEVQDNVAIGLVSYFTDHIDCPDEEEDEELHWKPWALKMEEDLRRRMAVAAIERLKKLGLLREIEARAASTSTDEVRK